MSIAIAGIVHVPDFRFGHAPLPPAAPGYEPLRDAAETYPAEVPSPATAPIPGTQATGSYAEGERYVVRVPDAWNGKLVVAGTSGVRSEFSNDAIWGDFLLSRGFAFQRFKTLNSEPGDSRTDTTSETCYPRSLAQLSNQAFSLSLA
jgi:hypothetical protein